MTIVHLKLTSSEQKNPQWEAVLPKGTRVLLDSFSVKGASTTAGIPDEPTLYIQVGNNDKILIEELSPSGIKGFGLDLEKDFTIYRYPTPRHIFTVRGISPAYDLVFKVKTAAGGTPVFTEINLKLVVE